MQINSVVNSQIIQRKQNFKGSSANSSPFTDFPSYQSIPLSVSKAYASPQITEGYREIKTFNLPDIGEGKVYELSNGHKIILVPKIGQTVIHTYIGVGENNEPANLKESSHLLEHLVSDYCTNPKTDEVKTILDKIGAECNAHTDETFSGYYISALIENPNNFEDLIKVQAQTLSPKDFSVDDIENEKKIVAQELSSGNKDVANYFVAKKLSVQNLFNLPDDTDLLTRRSTEAINNLKKEDLVNYYNTFYQPNNMVTTIVGNVNSNSIKTIAKYFNNIKQPVNNANNIYPKISIDHPIQKTTRKDVQSLDKNDTNAYIDLTFIGPKNTEEKENILVQTLMSIINERIKESANKNSKVIDLYSKTDNVYSGNSCPSLLHLNGTSDNNNVEDNIKTIYSILSDLKQNPISEEELKIIKENTKDDWTHFAEDTFILSTVIAEQELSSKNLDEAKELKFIDFITAKDIQNTAKKYLDLNKASLVVIHPQEKNKEAEKTNKVSFKGNIEQIDTKDIYEYKLPNNLKVIIDTRPGIVRSTVGFQLESQKKLENNPEAHHCLNVLLASDKIGEKTRNKGITISSGANSQGVFTVLNGTSDKTVEMLNYAVATLFKPNLNIDDFNKIKDLLEKNNSADKEMLEQKVNEEWLKGSPYLHQKGNISNLTFEDVKNMHQQILQNSQGIIFITMPKEKFNELKSDMFQALMQVPKVQSYNQNVVQNKYKPTALEKTKVFLEGNDDNQIRIDKIFKIINADKIQDRAGLMLLNSILGGDNKSKLFQHLRNEDKISYDAYSSFDLAPSTRNSAKITLSTTVLADSDNLKTVLKEYDKCIDELVSTLVSKEELNREKVILKSSILKAMETSQARNYLLRSDYGSNYGINYQKELFNAIDNMTPEYIQNLAKNYFNQPYLLAISGNKKILDKNMDYLVEHGEIVQV